MTVAGDPAIDDRSEAANPGENDDAAEHRPPSPAEHEGSGHGHVSLGSGTVVTDPLHGPLALLLGQAEFGEVEGLPGHDAGATPNSPLDETDTARAKGTVTVEHEERSIHVLSVPAKSTGHVDGTRPITGWA
jgi:hypothetical protein